MIHIKLDNVTAVYGTSLVAQMEESDCSQGDMGSIPVLGKSTGEGNGYPLQYSCLENSTDRGTWGHKESDKTE